MSDFDNTVFIVQFKRCFGNAVRRHHQRTVLAVIGYFRNESRFIPIFEAQFVFVIVIDNAIASVVGKSDFGKIFFVVVGEKHLRIAAKSIALVAVFVVHVSNRRQFFISVNFVGNGIGIIKTGRRRHT